jgi:hypothetical protein
VAVRDDPLLFVGTATVSVAVPVPLAGVTLAQFASLDAVHAHVEALAVSVTAEEPAPYGRLADVGATVKLHGGGTAACVTV